jgi:hypothetical protein
MQTSRLGPNLLGKRVWYTFDGTLGGSQCSSDMSAVMCLPSTFWDQELVVQCVAGRFML